jgi:hypothetical protein
MNALQNKLDGCSSMVIGDESNNEGSEEFRDVAREVCTK